MGVYSISVKLRHVTGSLNWCLTLVYGWTTDADKRVLRRTSGALEISSRFVAPEW
jgi:hypothetical protein